MRIVGGGASRNIVLDGANGEEGDGGRNEETARVDVWT